MDVQELYIVLLGIISLIALYSFIGALFQKIHFHYIHQTGVGILLGLIFGLVVYWLNDLSSFSFNQQIFFIGLLPPMIFAGGYNLKKRKFFQNFKYILIFGVFGTIISFFVIFSLTYLINKLQWIKLWDTSQTVILSTVFIIKFSATICATDSVAALTLIKPEKYPKLFSVIFGQGMVNDAVAIILFKVVGNIFDSSAKSTGAYEQDNVITVSIVLQIIWQFIYTVVISLIIGGGVAIVCSIIFRKCRFLVTNPVCQVVIIYLFGICSYIIAQMANMSGVLTVLVCGVTLAHFNFYNLTLTGQLSTGITFQSISFIAQAIVFIYLGLSTVYYVTQFQISPSFFGMELVICVISRLTAIFGLSIFFKLISKKQKWTLSYYQLAIVSMAGTIRGSVAFALILTIEAHHEQDQKIVQMLKSTVLLMVFTTTILLGAFMPTFVKFCLSRDNPGGQLQISFLEQEKQKREKAQKPRSLMKVFDEDYLKRWMIYDYKNRKQEIKQLKQLLKMNSPEYKGGQYVALIKANIRQTIVKEQFLGPKKKKQPSYLKPQSLLQSNFLQD